MTPAPPPSLLESLSADKDKGKDKGESAKGLVEEADANAGSKKPYTQDHVLDQHKGEDLNLIPPPLLLMILTSLDHAQRAADIDLDL